MLQNAKQIAQSRLVEKVNAAGSSFESLDDQTQSLALLREFCTSRRILKATPSNALSVIIEMLLRGGQERRDPAGLARECYERIQQWLTEQFFTKSLREPIVGFPLIPACLHNDPRVKGVYHCEARFAFRRDVEGRFERQIPLKPRCPRMKAYCMEKHELQPKTTFARILPRQSLNWSDWSLFELCEVAGIKSVHLEQAFGTRAGEGDEAINRLAGGINRLNEIRERLSCRECGRRLNFGNSFTVMDACYRATVTLPCECGSPSVYFSHCKGCGDIIDSRDSKLKDESSYYICISCASGEDVEEAGAICPKCGTKNSLKGPRRNKQCTAADCNHEVELPLRARRAQVSTSSD